MPLRKTIFANGEIYHILNKGVASAPIFKSSIHYKRFLMLADYYRFEKIPLSFSKYIKLPLEERIKFKRQLVEKGTPIVEIYCYCLMPNHFHLLLRQVKEKGIQKMLSNLQNSYVRYFNLKTKRSGPLFQSRFKALWIETDEILLHVSRYIHLNPVTSYIIEIDKLANHPWTSFSEYTGKSNFKIVNNDMIISLSGGIENYKKFIFNQVDYQRKLQKIKHLTLEKIKV